MAIIEVKGEVVGLVFGNKGVQILVKFSADEKKICKLINYYF